MRSSIEILTLPGPRILAVPGLCPVTTSSSQGALLKMLKAARSQQPRAILYALVRESRLSGGGLVLWWGIGTSAIQGPRLVLQFL